MMETRHTVRTEDGYDLALYHLRGEGARVREPVFLMPGSFSTRFLWLGTRGEGMARTLARSGFDVWVLEPRGHGRSDRPGSWRMSDWIRWDAPAAVRRLLEESEAERFFWVGHSAGGVVGAAFAGEFPDLAEHLGGMVMLGSPGPAGVKGFRRIGARVSHVAASLLPWARIPGRLLRLGPESEPAPFVREWMGWNLDGAWRGPEGRDYLEALGGVSVPLLAVAGAGDPLLAPPVAVRDLAERFASRDRTLVVAGVETGYRIDYGHAELVVSRAAREEIWPLVRDWLCARATVPAERGGEA